MQRAGDRPDADEARIRFFVENIARGSGRDTTSSSTRKFLRGLWK
jgi:hypothetical protein